MIAKGVNFTVKLIQSVGNAKRCVLAALFDKGKKEMIDEVLGRIEYDDRDLYGFTHFQNELAGSPEKFFRVLDKIKDPKNQEEAVRCGVIYLHRAERHDLIVPLVDALEKKMFKSDRLKDRRSIQHFVMGLPETNKILYNYITNILRLSQGDIPSDCLGLGTVANRIKLFNFY